MSSTTDAVHRFHGGVKKLGTELLTPTKVLLFYFGSADGVPLNSDRFFPIFGGTSVTTEASILIALPFGGKVKRLKVKSTNNTRADATIVTIQTNQIDTALLISIAAGINSTTEDVDNVSFVAGDTLAVNIRTGAGAGTVNLAVLVEVEWNTI